jgi:hypothetical protein
MLERFHKNKCSRDSYFILCVTASEGEKGTNSTLAGRAGQTTSETYIPYGPSYNGGAHFQRGTNQGCKKLAGNKSLVQVHIERRICHSSEYILSSKLLTIKKLSK